MFQDVDETLRAVLVADVPIKKNEVDLAFDRPTRDWSSRLSRPTLNLFLADIRERIDLKDDVDIITRDENGKAVRQRPPRRVDLAYLVSAWTTESDDEHRILARVLASMYRTEDQSRLAARRPKGRPPCPSSRACLTPDEVSNRKTCGARWATTCTPH